MCLQFSSIILSLFIPFAFSADTLSSTVSMYENRLQGSARFAATSVTVAVDLFFEMYNVVLEKVIEKMHSAWLERMRSDHDSAILYTSLCLSKKLSSHTFKVPV